MRASRACVLSVVINLFLAVTANCLNKYFLCTCLTSNYHMFNFNELIYLRCYVAGMFQASFCYRIIRCYLNTNDRCPSPVQGQTKTNRCPSPVQGQTKTNRCPSSVQGQTKTNRCPSSVQGQTKTNILPGCLCCRIGLPL